MQKFARTGKIATTLRRYFSYSPRRTGFLKLFHTEHQQIIHGIVISLYTPSSSSSAAAATATTTTTNRTSVHVTHSKSIQEAFIRQQNIRYHQTIRFTFE